VAPNGDGDVDLANICQSQKSEAQQGILIKLSNVSSIFTNKMHNLLRIFETDKKTSGLRITFLTG